MIRRFPSLYLLAFVILGIVFSDKMSLSPYLSLAVAAASLAVAAWMWRHGRLAAAIVGLGLLFAALSSFHFSLLMSPAGPNHAAQIVRQPTLCQVYGRVADWPELKPGRTEIVVSLDSLSEVGADWSARRPVDGNLLLKVTDSTTALQRGDRISLVARLYPVTPRGGDDFDYGRFLNLKGVFAQAFLPTLLGAQVDKRPAIGFSAVVDRVRTAIRSVMEEDLSPIGSALARGFLIGETRDIPTEVYAMFRDSGTLHLLAVSGSNVALVLIFFVWVMRPFWLGPRTRTVILLAVIGLFAGLSYGDPSVVRASIMAALVLGARQLGRSIDLNNLVALTALIILMVDPAQLYDVGFQLSFITAWGLVFAVPPLTDRFRRFRDRAWYRWLLVPLVVVAVAQVCSTPIIAYYFDRVPTISLFANLLIVPLVSIAVLGILVLLVAHTIWPLLGALVGSMVDLVLNTVIALLTAMGGEQIPVVETGPWFDGVTGQVLCLLIYTTLVLLVLALNRQAARRAAVWLVLIAVNVGLAAAVVFYPANDKTVLTCRTVPGGVVVLVQRPGPSHPDLVITGLSDKNYDLAERVLLPSLRQQGVGQIDRVFLLSADYGALDDLLRACNELEVDSLYAPLKLGPSLADVRMRTRTNDSSPGLSFYRGGRGSGPDRPGYVLGDGQLGINLGQNRIDVVDKLSNWQLGSSDGRIEAVLIVGSPWSPAAADWIRLRENSYRFIVCAKMVQAATETWPDAELDPDQVPPDYLIDLSKVGQTRLYLPF